MGNETQTTPETQGQGQGSGQGQGQNQSQGQNQNQNQGQGQGQGADHRIAISVDEFQRYRDAEVRLARLEAEKAAEVEEKEQERLRAIAERDGAQSALAEQKRIEGERYKALQDKHDQLLGFLGDRERDAVIAQAIAGREFAGATDEERAATARDFIELVKGRFKATRDEAGRWSVRDAETGRNAADVLREVIASKPYFFAPTHRGGSGSNGSGATPPAQNGGDSLEAFGAAWRAQNNQNRSRGMHPLT